jgi:hypothetical protein
LQVAQQRDRVGVLLAGGADHALDVLRELIGPQPDDATEAVQVAVASFTRRGFEATAITGFLTRTSALRLPWETGVERTAILRFDHPYAAVAIAGRPTPPQPAGPTGPRAAFTGLPVFSAWVQEPQEAEEEAAAD